MTASDPFQSPDGPTTLPFESGPTEPTGGGCGRVGVIGCGVLTLLLGIAAVVFLLKAQDLFVWVMQEMEAEVSRALPEDLPQEDRQRLRDAFAGATAAVRSGEFDPSALRKMLRMLGDSVGERDQHLTPEQVLELTRALEEVAGGAPEGQPVEDESSTAVSASAAG